MRLKDLDCPQCKRKMENRSTKDTKSANTNFFGDCLRMCKPCGIGYSNDQSRPTLIYACPFENIPEEVRDHVDKVIKKSLNVTNRNNKKRKIGYNSSEDALTWTVFRYFQLKDKIDQVVELLTKENAKGSTSVYYWGVPIDQYGTIDEKRLLELKEILNELGEEKQSYSEPDIILEDDEKIIFVEVKLGSENNKEDQGTKWDKYNKKDYYERDLSSDKNLKSYQLVRNWTIGNRFAERKNKRFSLVNLKFDKTKDEGVEAFENIIREKTSFIKCDWQNILKNLNGMDDTQWLKDWLSTRKPKIPM